jgi:receptor protein-tyrosine kinase
VETEKRTSPTSLEQTLRVLLKRWVLILFCGLLAAVAAVGISLTQPKEYTASSQLLFQNTQFDQQLFGSNFISPVADATSQQATNISLVALPTVAARTGASLHIPARVVASEVSISGVGQSNLAKVTVTDREPTRTARIANIYAQQYVLFRQQADRATVAAARRLVQRQLNALTPERRAGSVGQQLQNRANDLGVLASLQTGNAQVAQAAGVPTSPSSPKTARNGALGALLGLLVGLGLVFLMERLDRRVREPTELEQIYGAPVLATVAQSRALAAKRADALPSSEMDSFALLRARLRYFNVDRSVRSLLVTSAASGEGKSTVALNLALVESMVGDRKVVLFEADLRRPSVATRLGIRSTAGTSEILSGNASLEECLYSVELPQVNGSHGGAALKVLTSGAIPPNPVELLSSQALVNLLNMLMQRFDLVIVDSPPMTLVSDAIPLVRYVSGVLIVARMGMITRSMGRHAAEQLHNLQAPVLGVVANAISPKEAAYYLGYEPRYYASGKREGKAAAVRVRRPELDWLEPELDEQAHIKAE